jgi:hypothetical protein
MKRSEKSRFPIIGKFRGEFSNRWKLLKRFFQSLETFRRAYFQSLETFPALGKWVSGYCRRYEAAVRRCFFIRLIAPDILRIVLAGLLMAVSATAAPLPGFRYGGLVADDAGRPYGGDTEAVVVMMIDGVEVHRGALLLEPVNGFNYELEAPQYTGREAYRSYAVKKGMQPVFYLLEDSQVKNLHAIGDIPPVGSPGDVARVDFWTGTDADGDGLSDAFETDMLEKCGGTYDDITEIDPDADSDGDGFSNLQEFIAGTDATWEHDYFCADNALIVSGKWMRLDFETTPGRMYTVWGSEQLNKWVQSIAAASPGGAATENGFMGTGHDMTLYAPMTNGLSFFKLIVE